MNLRNIDGDTGIKYLLPNKLLNQYHRAGYILRLKGSLDGIPRHLMHLKPEACLARQRLERRWTQATARLLLHSFGEERMIAIPLTSPIERLQEKTRPLQAS